MTSSSLFGRPGPGQAPTAVDDRRYEAVSSRDQRFDGHFVTAVRTTGIYCRPSCPARTPQRRNVTFYVEAAAAEDAGFRACKRCRPDRAPGAPDVDHRGDLVGRALRLIDAGAVDEGGVAGLAETLHVSERHLHRVFVDELGTGPQSVARSRRVRLARRLLESSTASIADVAFASGFGSLRQFNDAVRAASGLTPTELRAAAPAAHRHDGLAVRLPFRPPYDTRLALRWVAGHAVPGVEEVVDGTWTRAFAGGTVTVTPGDAADDRGPSSPDAGRGRAEQGSDWLLVADTDDSRSLGRAVRSVRRVLDLDADPQAVNAVLAADQRLAPLVAAKPGLRCLGAWDDFEGLVRIVIGQQVSVRGAATLTGRLAVTAGSALSRPRGTVTHAFPTAEQVAAADLTLVGLTRARSATVTRLAEAVVSGAVPLGVGATSAEILEALAAVKGIGPWTLASASMRVLRDPDAWPVGDLILRRACAAHGIDPDTGADGFRPWRAYAATHLWEDIWTAPV